MILIINVSYQIHKDDISAQPGFLKCSKFYLNVPRDSAAFDNLNQSRNNITINASNESL